MGWKWKRVKCPDTPGEIRDRERRAKRRQEVDALLSEPDGPMTKEQRDRVAAMLRRRAAGATACARNASTKKEAMEDVADAIACRVAIKHLRKVKFS